MGTSPTSKRHRESTTSSPEATAVAKKPKTNGKKTISTSELLRKSGARAEESKRAQENEKNLSAAEKARRRAKERQEKEKARLAAINPTKSWSESVDSSKEGENLVHRS